MGILCRPNVIAMVIRKPDFRDMLETTKPAHPPNLTEQQEVELLTPVRKQSAEQRLVRRATIILRDAQGFSTKAISAELCIRASTVGRWIRRRLQAPKEDRGGLFEHFC